MSAPRLYFFALLPVIAMSLGCASGSLYLETRPLSLDRMMGIGQTFERQGRFTEAQYVYQQILAQDPTSPAAERLLAVIAAAEIADAQNLPVERLMTVGEFYERQGDILLAQGVYNQIVHREPDFQPARKRLEAIIAHQRANTVGHTPKSTAIIKASTMGTFRPTPIETKTVQHQNTENNVASSDAMHSAEPIRPTEWRARPASQGRHHAGKRQPADPKDAAFELPRKSLAGSNERSDELRLTTGEEDQSAAVTTDFSQEVIPPAPSETHGQSTPVSPPDSRISIPNNETRVSELWQDKPLGQLKASITVKFPQSEQLRDTELARLSQATPHLQAHGQVAQTIGQTRPWMLAGYEWEAPATRHLPLWFEEPNLERMGYTYGMKHDCCCNWDCCCLCGDECGSHCNECLQPFISAGHFFGRVAFIPYMCGIDPPCEPVYTLGVDRPGSPVPYRRYLIPVTLKAALYQAGAVVGIAYIFP